MEIARYMFFYDFATWMDNTAIGIGNSTKSKVHILLPSLWLVMHLIGNPLLPQWYQN